MESAAEQLETPIGGVQPDQVMLVWDRVEPLLERAVVRDTGQTLDSVRMALMMAQMQLWVVGDFLGIMVTSIEDRPAERILFVQYVAGEDMKSWIDECIQLQEDYALHNNCVAVEFSGRRGWNKVQNRHPEYKSIRTIFRREF